jgi:hypothetical protein
MATYRFYLAARDGDGLSHRTAFRSRLTQYIVADGSQDFWDWSNRATAFRFCLALCSTAKHSQIAADPGVQALSPELADVPAIQAWLDGPIGTDLPLSLQTVLENAGIPVDWIIASTTLRALWQFVLSWHYIAQRVSGVGDNNVLNFLASNLDSTVASLSAVVRTRVSNWMTEKGLDASWITGPTLVREVVKYIVQNLPAPPLMLGPVEF